MKGVFFMRKIIFCLLCVLFSLNVYIVNASEVTNHPEFQEIRIPKGSSAKLIKDMDDRVIEGAYASLKKRFLGWSINVIVANQMVQYTGDTVFAKKNNTSQYLKYTYYCKQEESITTSVSASSTISGKASGKIKAVSASLDAEIRGEIGKKTYVSKSESTEILITIPPMKKLTITIRGEARLNNGVCKYYILGIPFKKGEWEYIDVINEYYDYYEETVY